MFLAIGYFIIIAFALLFAIFHFLGGRNLYNKTSHIRGPKAFPLIGSAHLFLGDSEYVLEQILKLCKTYGSPFRLVLGHEVAAVIQDPEQIKTVLSSSKTVEKNNIYRFLKPWLGNGLLTADHSTWRPHRKLIQPAFAPRILESFIQIFQNNTLLVVRAMAEELDGPEFELAPYINLVAFYNICETSLGVSVEAEKKEIEEHLERSERVLKLIVERMVRIWLYPDIIYNLSKSSRKFYDCVKQLQSFTDDIIQKRRKYLQRESDDNEDGCDLPQNTAGKKKPFLDSMLEMADNEKRFTDEEIREHVDTVMSAGHDTVTRTNVFLLLMLASNPEMQDKVYEELYTIYGAEDPEKNPVKLEDLRHLEYMERFIKETMRLFPAGILVSRVVSEDLVLDGHILPKGCGASIFILSVHRDERIWPEPLKFDPDRFLPEEIKKRHPCAFIPFSHGSRDCIGRTYAMMSMKILLGTILRKYVIKKDVIKRIEDIKLKGDVLLMTSDPITLRIERRVK